MRINCTKSYGKTHSTQTPVLPKFYSWPSLQLFIHNPLYLCLVSVPLVTLTSWSSVSFSLISNLGTLIQLLPWAPTHWVFFHLVIFSFSTCFSIACELSGIYIGLFFINSRPWITSVDIHEGYPNILRAWHPLGLPLQRVSPAHPKLKLALWHTMSTCS